MFIWTISDAIGVLVIGFFVIVFLFVGAVRLFEQWLCKHNAGVRETMACDAICLKCGANLGFIGAWRERSESP